MPQIFSTSLPRVFHGPESGMGPGLSVVPMDEPYSSDSAAVRHIIDTVVAEDAAPARIHADEPKYGRALPMIGVVVVVPGVRVVPITVVPMPA